MYPIAAEHEALILHRHRLPIGKLRVQHPSRGCSSRQDGLIAGRALHSTSAGFGVNVSVDHETNTTPKTTLTAPQSARLYRLQHIPRPAPQDSSSSLSEGVSPVARPVAQWSVSPPRGAATNHVDAHVREIQTKAPGPCIAQVQYDQSRGANH